MCNAWEKNVIWQDLVSLILYKKDSKKNIFAYLPCLAFSEMLPEPYLFFHLA